MRKHEKSNVDKIIRATKAKPDFEQTTRTRNIPTVESRKCSKSNSMVRRNTNRIMYNSNNNKKKYNSKKQLLYEKLFELIIHLFVIYTVYY